MDDSSVQFASSYGAGSSYGASPQYTQVGFPFFHIKTISVFCSTTQPIDHQQVKQEPDFSAGPGLALSGGHHAIALSPRSRHTSALR